MTVHKNKKMSNTNPTKNPGINLGVLEGYFRLFIVNCLYNLLIYTICISIQQCKPGGGYQALDRRCWLFCIITYRSRWFWRPRIIRYLVILFLIDFMFHLYWFVYRIVIVFFSFLYLVFHFIFVRRYTQEIIKQRYTHGIMKQRNTQALN